MQRNLKKLVAAMTLEEKASLCSGLDSWHTKPVERLGIPSVMMTDGPHGLRKETDEMGESFMHKSIPATCFPTGAALACSWDTALLRRLGEALAEECLANGVSIVLGPAVNIKRSPLCGRNFEYYSEDPALSTELAAAYIDGVQSKGVGTSIKHFAANNQEKLRMTIDARVDERTLREIYLASFEGAIKKAKPWTVMCSYNRLNGAFNSENKKLLTDILKEEWGFEGLVMSDWGAVNERDDGLAAGLDLEMPSSNGAGDRKIVAAVQSGRLPEEKLDDACERILRVVFAAADHLRPGAACDLEAHHRLARRIAGECMVLLKNNGVLPLKKQGTLAVIGGFAKTIRYQGGGSSHINPYRLDVPLDEIKAAGGTLRVTYSEGYRLNETADIIGGGFASGDEAVDGTLIGDAVRAAEEADAAVIFAGLPDSYESEGYDRSHIRLPESHVKLIEAVAARQKNVVVVLCNGSPVEMPWLDRVAGVLEGYLGGEAAGGAIADLLFGDVCPSGKLAETFPVKLSDNPSYLNFPGDGRRVHYREGLFVGYRYYEKKEMKPLFPFGFGLSYTTFEYTGIRAGRTAIDGDFPLHVTVRVKNTGCVAGKETVQLYVRDLDGWVVRPVKELKGFQKVALAPGEEKAVAFTLDERAFAHYDEDAHDWAVTPGQFELLAGGCSDGTPLRQTVEVRGAAAQAPFTLNSTFGEILQSPKGYAILSQFAGDSMTANIPESFRDVPLRGIRMAKPEITDEQLYTLLMTLNQ